MLYLLHSCYATVIILSPYGSLSKSSLSTVLPKPTTSCLRITRPSTPHLQHQPRNQEIHMLRRQSTCVQLTRSLRRSSTKGLVGSLYKAPYEESHGQIAIVIHQGLIFLSVPTRSHLNPMESSHVQSSGTLDMDVPTDRQGWELGREMRGASLVRVRTLCSLLGLLRFPHMYPHRYTLHIDYSLRWLPN